MKIILKQSIYTVKSFWHLLDLSLRCFCNGKSWCAQIVPFIRPCIHHQIPALSEKCILHCVPWTNPPIVIFIHVLLWNREIDCRQTMDDVCRVVQCLHSLTTKLIVRLGKLLLFCVCVSAIIYNNDIWMTIFFSTEFKHITFIAASNIFWISCHSKW